MCFVLIAFHVNISLPVSLQIAAQKSTTLRSKILRIDFLGSFTLVTMVSCFLVGTTFKAVDEVPWSDPLVYGLFIGAAVSLVAFLFVEAKVAKEPILPMRLLTQRTPVATALANFGLSIAAYSILYNIPLYFEAVRLQTSSQAGLHLLPNSVSNLRVIFQANLTFNALPLLRSLPYRSAALLQDCACLSESIIVITNLDRLLSNLLG